MKQSVKSIEAQSKLQHSRLKKIFFSVISQQLNETNINSFLYSILLVIETMQMVYYSLHNQYNFLWQTNLTNVLQYMIKFFDFSGWIHQFPSLLLPLGSLSNNLFDLALIVLLLMLVIIVREVLLNRHTERKFTSIDQYIVKSLNALIVLFKTIMYIPFLYAILSMVAVKRKDMYYSIVISMGVVGLVIFVTFAVIFNLFYVSALPFHQHPMSCFDQFGDTIRNLIKTLLPIYLVFDRDCVSTREFLIVMALMYIIWCLLLMKLQEPYHFPQRMFYNCTAPLCLWFYLCVVYQSYNQMQSQGLIYTLFGAILTVMAWRHIMMSRRRHIASMRLSQAKNERDVVLYILEVIRAIEEQAKNIVCSIWLKGVLFEHSQRCTRVGCCCSHMLSNINSKIELTQKEWYTLLKNIIENEIQSKHKESIRLNLILSYIYLCRLNNKYRSIYHINRLDDNEPGLFLQMQCHFFRSYIQRHIDQQNRSVKDSHCVDLQNLLLYHQGFSKFRQQLLICCKKHIEFWKELHQSQPEGIKLYDICNTINHELRMLKIHFHSLQEINPNSMQLLVQYYDFQVDVRSVEADQLKNRIDELRKYLIKKAKSDQTRKQYKYSDSTDTGILVVSANENDLGDILYVNHSVRRMLGFGQKQLIGNKLNLLIPEYLHILHDEKLREYIYGASERETEVVSKSVLVLNNTRHINYMSIVVQTLPNISHGVALVGYVYELPCEPRYIICDQNGDIKGTSKGFTDHFGVGVNFTCNIKTALDDLDLNELLEGSVLPIKRKMTLEIESNMTSLKRFDEKEWEVNVFLKQKTLLSEKNTIYMISLIDVGPKEASDILEIDLQSLKQDIIKGGSELGDGDKQVASIQKLYNETQTMIDSDEQSPKMKWLAILTYASLLFLMVLVCLTIPLFDSKSNQVQQYAQSIQTVQKLLISVIQVSIQARKLNKLVRNNTQPLNFSTDSYSNAVNQANNKLSDYNALQLARVKQGIITDTLVNFWSVTTSAIFKQISVSLDAATVQYQTASANLENSNVADFNFSLILQQLPPPLTSIQQNFMIMRYNLLYSIIPAMSNRFNLFEQAYASTIFNCNYSNLISLCVAISFIVLITSLSIFANLKTIKIGLDVMGLLGYFDSQRISANIKEIVSYEETHFGDMDIQRFNDNLSSNASLPAISKPSETQNNAKPRTSIQFYGADSKETGRKCIDSDAEQFPSPSEIQQLKKSSSKKKIGSDRTKNVKERQNQLMGTRLSESWRIVLKYIGFGLVLLAYFISDYMLVTYNLRQLLTFNKQCQIISKRLQYTYVIRYYTEEYIYYVLPFYSQPSLTDQIKGYINDMYENERQVQSIPTDNSFQSLIKKYDVGNICDMLNDFTTYSNANLTYSECVNLHNSVLMEGLRSSLVTLSDLCQAIYIESAVVIESDMLKVDNSIQFFELTRLEEYIRAVLTYQLSTYTDFLNTIIQNQRLVLIVKMSLFLVLLLVMIFWIWRVFLKQMHQMVINIKGIVLIMSFRKIECIPNLKDELIKRYIIQAST